MRFVRVVALLRQGTKRGVTHFSGNGIWMNGMLGSACVEPSLAPLADKTALCMGGRSPRRGCRARC
jgi:hypothetical protein